MQDITTSLLAEMKVLITFFPGWPATVILLITISKVAGIIGMHHPTWLKKLKLFFSMCVCVCVGGILRFNWVPDLSFLWKNALITDHKME
jgi:hypothetical protein